MEMVDDIAIGANQMMMEDLTKGDLCFILNDDSTINNVQKSVKLKVIFPLTFLNGITLEGQLHI